MLVASALVFIMMPGLALVYGGVVGRKNVISSMVQSYVAIGVVSVLWVMVGNSLAFGPDHGGVVAGFHYVMLRGVGDAPNAFAPHVRALLFMAFQMKFAVITPALVAGAIAGLAAITPALGYVPVWASLMIGVVLTGLFAILWLTEKTAGLRVSPLEQVRGLDESDIGERAYLPESNQELAR